VDLWSFLSFINITQIQLFKMYFWVDRGRHRASIQLCSCGLRDNAKSLAEFELSLPPPLSEVIRLFSVELPPTKEEVKVFARVRLSVCLLARLLKNACMDLDEMLLVDRSGKWTNWLIFEPDPDHSPDAGTGLLSPISHKRCNADFYYVGKIPSICIGRPSL